MNLFLREPNIEDKNELLQMSKELAESGDEHLFEGGGKLEKVLEMPYEDWLKELEKDKNIELINPDWSNSTNYVLVDDNNHIYGFSTLRHSLKGQLINIGGNISYIIRPTERRKGYATIQLELLLDKAKDLGLEKVLVICRDNNEGSRKTIEKCLGVQDKSVPSRYPNVMELRYWVPVKQKENKLS